MTTDKSTDELKKIKGARILAMITRAQEMLDQLKDDVTFWSSDAEITPEEMMEHTMHQNETVANLQFFINYLQNKRRSS
jgi:hypothetical protein